MNIFMFSIAFPLLLLIAPVPAVAQIESIQASPDVTLELAGVPVTDEDVATDGLSGIVVPLDVGMIPPNAELSLYHQLDNGDDLLAFDITVELPGAVIARPTDVIRHSGGVYSVEFDGSANGVPAGARLDALSADADGDLLMSFDTTVALPGVTAADEDVVEFDGADFSLLFDGSAAGLTPAVDLDALHFAPGIGRLYVSFDTGGTIDGTNFSDEDLLEHDPVGGNWSLAYDGSTEHGNWIAADLDAAFIAFLADFIFKDGFESL